jgi:hypothetical protein
MTNTWPPTVADVKIDAGITVDTDDTVLATELAAAVAFVRDKRKRFNYDADPLCDLPNPTDDLWLGTVRLAGRWHSRRRSVDGLVDMGDLGAARVPSVDPDIERLLGIGRFAKGAFA